LLDYVDHRSPATKVRRFRQQKAAYQKHRGQAHALLTAAGEKTGDTDLFLVVPGIVE
jgi:hypothetical protein